MKGYLGVIVPFPTKVDAWLEFFPTAALLPEENTCTSDRYNYSAVVFCNTLIYRACGHGEDESVSILGETL
jgi:hypothetical protein